MVLRWFSCFGGRVSKSFKWRLVSPHCIREHITPMLSFMFFLHKTLMGCNPTLLYFWDICWSFVVWFRIFLWTESFNSTLYVVYICIEWCLRGCTRPLRYQVLRVATRKMPYLLGCTFGSWHDPEYGYDSN